MSRETEALVEKSRELMERRQALLATPGPELDRVEAELAAAVKQLREAGERSGAKVLKG